MCCMLSFQDVLRQVTSEEERKVFLESNEDKIIKLQSTFRGYTARKQYKDRLSYLSEQEPQVIKLQVTHSIVLLDLAVIRKSGFCF